MCEGFQLLFCFVCLFVGVIFLSVYLTCFCTLMLLSFPLIINRSLPSQHLPPSLHLTTGLKEKTNKTATENVIEL